MLTLFEIVPELHGCIESLLHNNLFVMHGDLLLQSSSLLLFTLDRLLDKFSMIVTIFLVKFVLRHGQGM